MSDPNQAALVVNGRYIGATFTDSSTVGYKNTTVETELDTLNQNLNSKQDAISLLTFTKDLPTHSKGASWDIASVDFGVTFQRDPIVMIYPFLTGKGPIAVSITELTRSGCKFGTYRDAGGAANTFIIKVLGVVN